MFYAESIKHGVKAVTSCVNHTIGIRYSEGRVVIEWGRSIQETMQVLHFRLKSTPLKDTNGKRESSNECSGFFCGLKKALGYEIVLRGISTMFSSRRSVRCPVLKFNQGSEVFEYFSGTFFTLRSRKLRF